MKALPDLMGPTVTLQDAQKALQDGKRKDVGIKKEPHSSPATCLKFRLATVSRVFYQVHFKTET